uniref:Uncharacterized protein n=1 Tax=Aegilops tauschii subsp. strangulata TaxID=200361 RepID=A0A453I3L4_AEGTS
MASPLKNIPSRPLLLQRLQPPATPARRACCSSTASSACRHLPVAPAVRLLRRRLQHLSLPTPELRIRPIDLVGEQPGRLVTPLFLTGSPALASSKL